MQGGLLLGIDGGASKTAGVMIDCSGRMLARVRLGRSSIIGKPNPESCQVLSSVVNSLCEQAGQPRDHVLHCGIGLNGIDFADEFAMQHHEISLALGFPSERVTLVNDGIVALWGASSMPAAILIQLGSGFTAAYRSQYGAETLFDHLAVSQPFDLRSGLIVAVARMINGQIPSTPLKDKALAFLGISDESLYGESVYRGLIPWERRAETIPLVFESWMQGDPTAAELVQRAIDDYALTAQAMIAKTGSRSPDIVFGGGRLMSAPPQFWASLAASVRKFYPDVTARPPDLPPELGAAIMAGHRVGLEPQALFTGVLGHARAASAFDSQRE